MAERRWALAALVLAFTALIGDGQGLARHVSIRVMGSTSLVGLVEASIPAYTAAHPDVSVHVSAGGSVAGLYAVASGHVELGVSDVPPDWVGLHGGSLVGVPLGTVPVVPIVHPGVGVDDVTEGELSGLLSGRIRDWKELRGRHENVVVVTRGPGSGALLVMERAVMGGRPLSSEAVVELSNGAVYRAVLATPGAIGFVEAGFVRPGVRALLVDGQRFRPDRVQNWPYQAPAAIYYRAGANHEVRALARYVARSRDRHRYGIYGEAAKVHGGAARA